MRPAGLLYEPVGLWNTIGRAAIGCCCVRPSIEGEVLVIESMTLDTLELDDIELLAVDDDEELGVGHGVTEIGASGGDFGITSYLV